MFHNPLHAGNPNMSEDEVRDFFETFYEVSSNCCSVHLSNARLLRIYNRLLTKSFRSSLRTTTSNLQDVFCELVKFGNLLEMHVCDNVGDHLIGNVYARYEWEDEAQSAVDDLNNRWYSGRPLFAELSPVTDFREACCRQNDMGECNRGGFCNFMHLREPPTEMLKELHHQQRMERRLNPSQRDIERQKEMEMFNMQYGGGGSGSGEGASPAPVSSRDDDRRDRDRDRERDRRR